MVEDKSLPRLCYVTGRHGPRHGHTHGITNSSQQQQQQQHSSGKEVETLCLAYFGNSRACICRINLTTGHLSKPLSEPLPFHNLEVVPATKGAQAWNLLTKTLYFVAAERDQGIFLFSQQASSAASSSSFSSSASSSSNDNNSNDNCSDDSNNEINKESNNNGGLRRAPQRLPFLPWCLACDPRHPDQLWCFYVKSDGSLALYSLDAITGQLSLRTDFEGKHHKVLRGFQDNYCGFYHAPSSQYFIFLEAGASTNKKSKKEKKHKKQSNRHSKNKNKKHDRRQKEATLLIVNTETLVTQEIPLQFRKRSSQKLNTLESFVYSKKWNCLLGFASWRKEGCFGNERERMQFVRVDIATGEVIAVGPQWPGHKRAEDGLLALDEENDILYTSIASEWSWFTTHWRYVSIDVLSGEVLHQSTWYNISSRSIAFFPLALSSDDNR
ncbi:hypothetical protein QOT17_012980 [Balamuthia mandrillaris]